MLEKLAEELELSGIAQVDLVFSGGKWYIIEVNPRISGMTSAYAAAEGKTMVETITEAAFEEESPTSPKKLRKVMNFKLPLLPHELMEKISGYDFVSQVTQIENYAATQKREVGYAEVIMTGDTFEELMKNLRKLKEDLPEAIEDIFFENAAKIIDKLS